MLDGLGGEPPLPQSPGSMQGGCFPCMLIVGRVLRDACAVHCCAVAACHAGATPQLNLFCRMLTWTSSCAPPLLCSQLPPTGGPEPAGRPVGLVLLPGRADRRCLLCDHGCVIGWLPGAAEGTERAPRNVSCTDNASTCPRSLQAPCPGAPTATQRRLQPPTRPPWGPAGQTASWRCCPRRRRTARRACPPRGCSSRLEGLAGGRRACPRSRCCSASSSA